VLLPLKVVLILPVATALVEIIVKNVLRSKMGEQFMSNYCICFVKKDMLFTNTRDVVIDRFRKVKNLEGKL
jgi:hypothetical protein